MDDSLALWLPASALSVGWTPAPRARDAGSPLWLGERAGQVGMSLGCSAVGFGQETEIRHVVEITHVFLEELTSGFVKIDFITSAALGNDNFLIKVGMKGLWALFSQRNGVTTLH